MKLKETVELMKNPFKESVLSEALRVSNRDMDRMIKLNQRDFRIGTEYEMHLNDGVVQSSSRLGPEQSYARQVAEDSLDNRIRNSTIPLARIFSFMMQAFDDGNDFISALYGEEFEEDDLTPKQKLDVLAKTINATKLAFNTMIVDDPIFSQAMPPDLVRTMKTVYEDNFNINDPASVESFFKRNEDDIEKMLDEVEDIVGMSYTPEAANRLVVREVERSDWYADELDAETSNRMSIMGDDDANMESDNVSYVRNTLPSQLMNRVENIELDSSVPDGVEVITRPLVPEDAFDFMEEMFEYIHDEGSTSAKTGMHVNLSHKSFSTGNQLPDPLKIIALMDPDFFQDATNVKKHIKYPERNNMVEQLTSSISNENVLSLIARGYLSEGLAGMEDMLKHAMVRDVKFRSINWSHFLKEYDPATRRIELRYFGGQGYENRFNEIVSDIKFVMYVVQAVTNSSYKPETYYRGLYRILDRAAKRAGLGGFNEVLQSARKNDTTSQILSNSY